jgi:putative nucleotidyltransferase with HDIG domain
LEKYGVPDHIIRHSEMVSKVAGFLAERLNKSGENLDLGVIEAAGLLHDITKMEGIESRRDHAQTGRMLLLELGFRKIGEIVGEHIRLEPNRETSRIREAEIINYSDKRVMHDRVVTLEERFEDLEDRYGLKGLDKGVTERIKATEQQAYELERKIFFKLDFPPEELLEKMDRPASG